jgi:lipopolysaccharide assembly outer membrane protein LptD (OstA)
LEPEAIKYNCSWNMNALFDNAAFAQFRFETKSVIKNQYRYGKDPTSDNAIRR